MIQVDFESILVPEDNGKQNLEEFYTNKYQKHVACSYGYKCLCIDDIFSKCFKSYLGKDIACKFLKIWSKKVKTVAMRWKNIFKKNCDN